jgi:hypothetical protein
VLVLLERSKAHFGVFSAQGQQLTRFDLAETNSLQSSASSILIDSMPSSRPGVEIEHELLTLRFDSAGRLSSASCKRLYAFI